MFAPLWRQGISRGKWTAYFELKSLTIAFQTHFGYRVLGVVEQRVRKIESRAYKQDGAVRGVKGAHRRVGEKAVDEKK
jgi:hypothetical protein